MEELNNTAQVDMFEEIKKHVMLLTYSDGEAEDFNEIVEINRFLEGLRIRLQDRDNDVSYYRRENVKKRLEITDLKKQIDELQKEKEDLKRLGDELQKEKEELLKRLARWEL